MSGAVTLEDFGITRERMQFVLRMVDKKMNAGAATTAHIKFRAYPPAEFLSDSEMLGAAGIYDRLRDSVWWVRWYDGSFDQFRFIEFVAFIHLSIQATAARRLAATAIGKHLGRDSKHAGGWQPKKNRGKASKRRVITANVKGNSFVPAEVVKDETIRVLLGRVTLEHTTRPNEAVN